MWDVTSSNPNPNPNPNHNHNKGQCRARNPNPTTVAATPLFGNFFARRPFLEKSYVTASKSTTTTKHQVCIWDNNKRQIKVENNK